MKPSRTKDTTPFTLAVVLGLVFTPLAFAQTPPKPAAVPPDHAAKMAEGLALFKERVRPLLIAQCLDCHGGKATKGDFDLSDRKPLVDSGVIEGGGQGEPALRARSRTPTSRTCRRRSRSSRDADIEDIARWIDLGAPYDRPLVDRAATAKAAPRPAVDDRPSAQFLVVPRLEPPSPPPVRDECVLGSHADRSLHPRHARSEAGSPRTRRPTAATLIRRALVRPDRACRRRPRRSTRSSPIDRPDAYETAGRPPARLAALRRALGAALDGRGPVRRVARLRAGLRPARSPITTATS